MSSGNSSPLQLLDAFDIQNMLNLLATPP